MNVTRKQIRSALEHYEHQVRVSGKSTSLEMHLYDALAGVVRGKVLDVPAETVIGFNEINALPPGTVLTSPLPDTESNVAERTTDGWWMITGESPLISTTELINMADTVWTVLRRGYGNPRA